MYYGVTVWNIIFTKPWSWCPLNRNKFEDIISGFCYAIFYSLCYLLDITVVTFKIQRMIIRSHPFVNHDVYLHNKMGFFAPGPFLGLQKTYALFSFWFILNTVHKYMKVKIKYRSRKPLMKRACVHMHSHARFFRRKGN